jgi:hypothetical protein
MELGSPMLSGELLVAAFGPALTSGAARAVGEITAALRPELFQRLLASLRQCDALVVSHPALVTVLVERIEGIPTATARHEARNSLIDLSFPFGAVWFGSGEAPSEYTDRREQLAAFAVDETLPSLVRAFYVDATAALNGIIATGRQRMGCDGT